MMNITILYMFRTRILLGMINITKRCLFRKHSVLLNFHMDCVSCSLTLQVKMWWIGEDRGRQVIIYGKPDRGS
jgi:hypothetical protein